MKAFRLDITSSIHTTNFEKRRQFKRAAASRKDGRLEEAEYWKIAVAHDNNKGYRHCWLLKELLTDLWKSSDLTP
jgi:hypothetical protein